MWPGENKLYNINFHRKPKIICEISIYNMPNSMIIMIFQIIEKTLKKMNVYYF